MLLHEVPRQTEPVVPKLLESVTKKDTVKRNYASSPCITAFIISHIPLDSNRNI